MESVLRKLALPIVVLGFYPLAAFLGDTLESPDIAWLVGFLWALVFALSFIISYRKIKS
jgi:hypothetical protein